MMSNLIISGRNVSQAELPFSKLSAGVWGPGGTGHRVWGRCPCSDLAPLWGMWVFEAPAPGLGGLGEQG